VIAAQLENGTATYRWINQIPVFIQSILPNPEVDPFEYHHNARFLAWYLPALELFNFYESALCREDGFFDPAWFYKGAGRRV
jgi:hypothetical protein